MPYTPPSTQSPNASRPETTASSRSHSCKAGSEQDRSIHQHPSRPGLPPSTSSYLHKHRRSPSITKVISPTENVITNGTADQSTARRGRNGADGSIADSQPHSAPPTRPDASAPDIISPSESSHTSSEDESHHNRRERDLVNLAELQDAIRTIEQNRTGSPEPVNEKPKQAPIKLDLSQVRSDISMMQPDDQTPTAVRPPLSAGARKISHSRSNTDTGALREYHRNQCDRLSSQSPSESDPEEFADDERRKKPVMVRKKSGELVRPALRPSYSKRRPSSMPGTPTFSKAVHFDPSLEHVRHFLQVDRPIAVSAGSSPVDSTLDDDAEYPFPNPTRSASPPFEWEIRLANFPSGTGGQAWLRPVQVERVYLSSDNKNLMGSVIVQNLAFHKSVVARFTLDYWKTTSEVVADFCSDVRRKHVNEEHDRFIFSINLEDQTHLENKTLVFCVRYNVHGQEFWDNNNSMNYQVLFLKKPVPQGGKNGLRGNRSRPLDTSRNASSVRPRSMPISSDDFATCFPPYEFPSFHTSSSAHMTGDSPLRFRNSPAGHEATSDGSGSSPDVFSQAFAGRYDFGVSLSAAIHGASKAAKSKPAKTMSFVPQLPVGSSSSAQAAGSPGGNRDGTNSNGASTSSSTTPVPEALTGEKPALQSSSYNELIDKYCFVRPRLAKATGEYVC